MSRPWQMKHNGDGLPCYPVRFSQALWDLFWCSGLEMVLLASQQWWQRLWVQCTFQFKIQRPTAAFVIVLIRPESSSCLKIIASNLHWMTRQGQEGISSFAKWSLHGPQGCLHALWLYNMESSSLPEMIFPGFSLNASMAHERLPCAQCAP